MKNSLIGMIAKVGGLLGIKGKTRAVGIYVLMGSLLWVTICVFWCLAIQYEILV